jgi:uncharacterized membrane protein
MTQANENNSVPSRAATWPRWVVLLLSLALFGLWLWGIPGDLLQKLKLVGYAICHRIPERSFVIGGQQLPLCARCTGIYLGVASNLTVMMALRRWRSAELPRPALLAVLFAFFLVMGLDGVNSYMTFFPGAPHLYEPRNWLRLSAGLLHGITLSALIFPIFNQTLWTSIEWRPALRNFGELGLVVVIGFVGAGLVVLEIPILLYPLAILSSGGVVVMLGMINTTLVVTILRHENRFRTWRQALAPLAVGLVLALVEVSGLDLFRAYLTQLLNLPF